MMCGLSYLGSGADRRRTPEAEHRLRRGSPKIGRSGYLLEIRQARAICHPKTTRPTCQHRRSEMRSKSATLNTPHGTNQQARSGFPEPAGSGTLPFQRMQNPMETEKHSSTAKNQMRIFIQFSLYRPAHCFPGLMFKGLLRQDKQIDRLPGAPYLTSSPQSDISITSTSLISATTVTSKSDRTDRSPKMVQAQASRRHQKRQPPSDPRWLQA